MRRILIIALVLALLVTAVPLTGCRSTIRINYIVANSHYYEGKEVKISGKAGNFEIIPALNKVAYRVTDDSGSIRVFTDQEPPEKGVQISVKGTVLASVKMGNSVAIAVIAETQRD